MSQPTNHKKTWQQDHRFHVTFVQAEEELLAEYKNKTRKKIDKINNFIEAMKTIPNDSPLLKFTNVDESDEAGKHIFYLKSIEALTQAKTTYEIQLHNHCSYVDKVKKGANDYPNEHGEAGGRWSVEGWRKRTKHHNKFWKNGSLIPI